MWLWSESVLRKERNKIDPKRGAFDKNQNTLMNITFAMSEYQSNTYQNDMLDILRRKRLCEKKVRRNPSKRAKNFEKLQKICDDAKGLIVKID